MKYAVGLTESCSEVDCLGLCHVCLLQGTDIP